MDCNYEAVTLYHSLGKSGERVWCCLKNVSWILQQRKDEETSHEPPPLALFLRERTIHWKRPSSNLTCWVKWSVIAFCACKQHTIECLLESYKKSFVHSPIHFTKIKTPVYKLPKTSVLTWKETQIQEPWYPLWTMERSDEKEEKEQGRQRKENDAILSQKKKKDNGSPSLCKGKLRYRPHGERERKFTLQPLNSCAGFLHNR